MEDANCQLRRLLRTRRERPSGYRTNCHFDEIASSHRLPQGLGLRQLCDYSRDLRPAEWGPIIILRGNNPQDRMSALGQKQTSRRVRAMSALPPKADMDQSGCDVRFVPKADKVRRSKIALFDHLVGAGV